MCTMTNENILNTNLGESPKFQNEDVLASNILEKLGLSILDAVRLVQNMLDFKPSKSKTSNIQFCSKIINLGIKHLHIKEMSIAKGFEEYLQTKAQLRPASLRDIKYLSRRLFKASPKFAKMNFSEFSISDCEKWLRDTFKTPPQFNKAHRFLNGLFNYALRREWLDRNIIKLVDRRKVIETEIKALTIPETKALLATSQLPKYQQCQAAVALLIWAGIRPQELQRLTWKDIDLDENIITIRPTTSKTGGCRHIEICKALRACILKTKGLGLKYITPLKWKQKWKSLRRKAGFKTWTQDVLRHTYASYHAKNFKDLSRLQLNMGHSNLHLLRTRYINLYNISKQDAKSYFSIVS